VGSNVWRKTTFRLICATNRNLLEEAVQGRFRKDLYYRIAAWNCSLPALRERIEDIPVLVRYFLRTSRPGDPVLELDSAVLDLLVSRAYPGNVRELKQLVGRIMSRHEGRGPITVGDVPVEERPPVEAERSAWPDGLFEQSIRQALARGVTLRALVKTVGETAIRVALSEERSLHRAARRLGVTDRALQLRKAPRRIDGAQPRVDAAGSDGRAS